MREKMRLPQLVNIEMIKKVNTDPDHTKKKYQMSYYLLFSHSKCLICDKIYYFLQSVLLSFRILYVHSFLHTYMNE